MCTCMYGEGCSGRLAGCHKGSPQLVQLGVEVRLHRVELEDLAVEVRALSSHVSQFGLESVPVCCELLCVLLYSAHGHVIEQ